MDVEKFLYKLRVCVGKNEKDIFEQEYSLYIDRVDVKRKSFNAYVYRKSSSCIGM